LTISKLSSEYELIVITSFGLNPLKILQKLLPTILISSIFLLINNLALMPKADYMRKIFLKTKEKEAQFNIKASQYGQQFGKWLIYVDKEKDGIYQNIVLYQQEKNIDNVIVAKKATINNNGVNLSLNLTDGKAIKIDKKISQINFKKMIINNDLKYTTDITSFDDLILYWKNRQQNDPDMSYFTFSVLSALLPILSIFLILSFGFYNPRYDKNKATIYSIAATILFMILSKQLSKEFGYVVLYIFPLIWIGFSYIVFYKKVKPFY